MDVRIFCKADPAGIFHARFLQTKFACVHLDRGFDLFNRHDGFFRNPIRFDRKLLEDVTELKNLDDVNAGQEVD